MDIELLLNKLNSISEIHGNLKILTLSQNETSINSEFVSSDTMHIGVCDVIIHNNILYRKEKDFEI